jgi:hypothetical protein
MIKRLIPFLIVISLLLAPAVALAQNYYFALPELSVDVYWNSDGSVSLDYLYAFQNQPNGHPLNMWMWLCLPTALTPPPSRPGLMANRSVTFPVAAMRARALV